MSETHVHHDVEHAHPQLGFWRKYVFSTDHKVIGIQYMVTAMAMAIIGGALSLLMRIQLAWPDASVLPVEVPVTDEAVEIGQRVARQVEREGHRVVFLASSDLTHYGPDYRFTPAGVGLEGLAWAKENDARVLARVMNMQPETIVPEVRAHYNACGAGAIESSALGSIRSLPASLRARSSRSLISFWSCPALSAMISAASICRPFRPLG